MDWKGRYKVLCLLFFWVTLCSEGREFRKFTSAEGSVIRAELLAASDSVVSLRRDDGVVFRDVPLQRFSEYDRHYIEVWISKFKEPERQLLYRVETGGRYACESFHGRRSRYIIGGSGVLLIVPEQWYCRRGCMLKNCNARFYRGKVQIYENNASGIVSVKLP